MTTDDEMLQARVLALKKAKAALKLEDKIVSVEIQNRLFNSEEGQGLSPSQKCAIKDILGALEAVLEGNTYPPHSGDCRSLHKDWG